MIDQHAVNRIVELGVNEAEANRLPLVPEHSAVIIDGKLVTLEHLRPGRNRFRGAFGTSSISAFAQYVSDEAKTAEQLFAGFIDPGPTLRAKVFLNLGSAMDPGHADWTASLTPERTAAYAAALSVNGNRLGQRELAEWIEDWSDCLTAQAADGEFIGLTEAIAAVRNINIKATAEAGHSDRDFGASRTAIEEIEAKAATGKMPARIILTTQPYPDLRERQITLRVAMAGGDKPTLGLRIIGHERQQEDIAAEFRELLLAKIGDAATMTIGTFVP